jgi:hypothetical protein
LLCCVAVAAGSDADVASLRAALASALEANKCWERTAAELREALAGRDAEIERQSAELERVSAALAVLQRMVFGDSSERSRPEAPAPGAALVLCQPLVDKLPLVSWHDVDAHLNRALVRCRLSSRLG